MSFKQYTVASLIAGLLLVSPTTYAVDLPGRLIDVGGHRLYIHCTGNGPTSVVIDSGMGGFSLEWQRVQARLSEQVRVCSYDRAGYGWSDSGPLPRTSARLAEELHTLLKRADVPGPYLLVGHSFGGYNIRYFAHVYPDDTAGLVLVDASHPDQFARFPRKNLPGKASSIGSRTLISRPIMPSNYPDEHKRQAFVLMATYKARQAQAEEFRSFMESAAEVRDISLPDVPILVLSRGRQAWPKTAYGDEMERIWADLQAELGHLSERTLHLVAANSGHSIHFDQPAAVSSAVLLTMTAAHGRWPSLESVTANDTNLIAPILNQATYLARR